MRFNLAGFACLLVILAAVAPASAWAQQDPTGAWNEDNSGWSGDYFLFGRAVSDGTYMYLIGGNQNSGSTTAEIYSRVRRYDPANESWDEMPRIAAGTNTGDAVWGTQYHAAAFHDDNGTRRMFIFGGYGYYGTVGSSTLTFTGYTNIIRMFTFTGALTGTWSQVSTATLSSTRYYHTAVTHGNRIHVLGGVSSNANEIFDPTTQTMVTGTSAGTTMPGICYFHGAVSVPSLNKIYVMGGYSQYNGANGYFGINWEYTPQDNDASTSDAGGTWTTRANINNGTSSQSQNVYYGPGCVWVNNRIYVLAGINQSNNAQNNVFEYNPSTNLWAQRANSSVGHYAYPGAAVIGNYAYLYGGYPQYNQGERFTPPVFGSAPNAPTDVAQTGSRSESSLQSLPDVAQFDGWTNSQITFSATVTDPNANQQVRMRVQVKPQAASWNTASAITPLDTGLRSQGSLSINFQPPSGGGYDWRWRVEDAFNNSYPDAFANVAAGWVEAFGNESSPDFRSDQVAPADPVGVGPANVDIQVPDPVYGDVVLNWIESTDNGPVDGISYELQVAREGGFMDIEAQLFSTAGTSAYPITLTVSRDEKHWRMRARDVGGNFSEWSEPLTFRVTHNDGDDHGAGDARKCGLMVGSGAPSLVVALLGLALIAQGGRRRFRM